MSRALPVVLASALTAVLVAGGFAIGQSGSSNTIRACANKKTGAVRLPKQAKRCTRRERTLRWNRQGPTGPPGQPGTDAQFAGTPAGGDLGGSYPNPVIRDGAVTADKLAEVPAARVGLSATQSIPASTPSTTVIWDTEKFDTAGLHDAAQPSRLTAPRAGIYLMTVSVRWQEGASDRALHLRRSGSSIIASSVVPATTGFFTVVTVSTTDRLAAGDYVEATVAHSFASARVISPFEEQTAFTMTWLAP